MFPVQPTFVDTSGHDTVRRAVKRAIDVFGAAVMLVVTAPLCAVIAAVVRCTSRGPVLFRHVRVGRGGQRFVLLKFRTMRDGTHAEVLAHGDLAEYARRGFKLPADDPRITQVGRLLRKTSLDELPQLWNVLRGEMSLVGVRPIEPLEFEHRRHDDQAIYVQMRPGITGLWQVKGRSTNDYPRRLALEREYVEHWSIWGDLVLLARTPLAVFRVRHAH